MSRPLAGAVAALIVGAASLAGGAATASGVEIERTAETWETCDSPSLEQPFERFGDNRDYVLAPSGAFENLDADLSGSGVSLTADLSSLGWQPSGGAGISTGNEAFYLRRLTDSASLSVPQGGSAISPAVCVDLDYPHMRLVTRGQSRLLSSAQPRLRVEVIYPEVSGATFGEVAILDPSQGGPTKLGWRVSNDVPLYPEWGGELPGSRLAALRFTALSGDWRIDDIYIDPRRHR